MKKYPHLAPCKCGRQDSLSKDNVWWINSPDHSNCFWVYLRHNTRTHTLLEVANLMDLSISAITSIEKKASLKMKRKFKTLSIEKE